jgi:hypothetical protein
MAKDLSEVSKLFTYRDGHLYWMDRPESDFPTRRGYRVFCSRFSGKIAGTRHSNGYWQINIGGSIYLSHRIIYYIHYGNVPDSLDIDHIDGNRDNSRIENLRLATRSQNLRNSASLRGVVDLAGVSFDKRRKKRPYYARIRVDGGRVVNLGVFKTPEEAHEAYCRAAKDLHGEFARTT